MFVSLCCRTVVLHSYVLTYDWHYTFIHFLCSNDCIQVPAAHSATVPGTGSQGRQASHVTHCLGPYLGKMCTPGASEGYLGASWRHLGASRGHLGTILGPSGAVLVPSWAVLVPSWGRSGPSWGRLGAVLERLRAILDSF